MKKEALEILHQLSKHISQATSLDAMYDLILEEIVQVMGVSRASIMRYEAPTESLYIVAAKGMEEEVWKTIRISVAEGVSGKVWQEGQPVLIKGLHADNPRYKSQSYMIAPVTCFPMKVGELPIGLINVTDKNNGEPFSEDDLRLLMILSDQVASYMHIYDLVGKVKEGEGAKTQIELARNIQQSLLPKSSPHLPGISVSGTLLTAERVGADFYDWQTDSGEVLTLSVADVSGHNIGGALLASSLRATLRAHSQHKTGPAETVESVNKMLFGDFFSSEQFVSLFYAQFNFRKKKLIYTNAGHPPAILLRADSQKTELLFTQDSLLGIEENLTYHEKEIDLRSGDVLLLYTDGITEALSPITKKPFGTEYLLSLLKESSKKEASQIEQFILSALKEFTGKATLKDDVTLVVLKLK